MYNFPVHRKRDNIARQNLLTGLSNWLRLVRDKPEIKQHINIKVVGLLWAIIDYSSKLKPNKRMA